MLLSLVVVSVLVVGATAFWFARAKLQRKERSRPPSTTNTGFADGPKTVLSSAIARALNKHFVVDASQVKSSLLSDAGIVLRNIQLREIATTRPKKDPGLPPTAVTVNGSVEEVAFSWQWTTGKTFVKDAKLTLKNIQCHGKCVDGSAEESEAGSQGNAEAKREEQVQPAPDEKTEEEIRKVGGWRSFVMKHVNKMIDGLTLQVDGLVVSLDVFEQVSGNALQTLEIGLESIQMLSFGRDGDPETETGSLRQTMEIFGFYATVIKKTGDDREGGTPTTFPFIEPFSYGAELIKMTGPRFGSFAKGVKLTGAPRNEDGDTASSGGFVLHFGKVQTHSLKMLGVMLLSPSKPKEPSSAPSSERGKDEEDDEALPAADSGAPEVQHGQSSVQDVSCFDFSFPHLTVTHNDRRMYRLGESVSVRYLGDGTMLKIEAGDVLVKGNEQNGWRIHGKGIRAENLVEKKIATFDEMDEFHLPNRFDLMTPVKNGTVGLEGKVLTAQIDLLEGNLLGGPPKQDAGDRPTSLPTSLASWSPLSPGGDCTFAELAQGRRKNWRTPFTISATVNKIFLFREGNSETKTVLTETEVSIKRTDDENGTDIALSVREVNRELINLKLLQACLVIPQFGTKTLENLNVAAGSVTVLAGYSKEDWEKKMLRRRDGPQSPETDPKVAKKDTSDTSSKGEGIPLRLPFAKVDTLRLSITFGGKGVSIKETSFVVKPFIGNETTTAKALVLYYASACLWKTPNFLTNADVLGLNLADAGSTIVSGTASVHNASTTVVGTVGQAGNVTATTAASAVNAVRATVDASKLSRVGSKTTQTFFDQIADSTSKSFKVSTVAKGDNSSSMEPRDDGAAATKSGNLFGAVGTKVGGGVGRAVGVIEKGLKKMVKSDSEKGAK